MTEQQNSAACGSLIPPPAYLLVGDELISNTGSTVSDFWAWCLSDLRTNTVRPMLAEFLVAKALGAADRPRIEWDACDVRADGITVEVKSSAYLQAWAQPQQSKVVFGGLSARTWTVEDGYSPAASYNADIYVFAVQTATDHQAYDALDLSQWSFWILPRSVVEATGQRSLSLARVQALAGQPLTWAELADQVRVCARRPPLT